MGVPFFGCNNFCCSAQGRQNETNLFGSAAGKKSDDWSLRLEPILRAKVFFRFRRPHHIHKRMAHELHVYRSLPVYVFLEGKDHEHFVDELLDLLHAAFTPGPNLRAHVVKNRSARMLDSLGKAKIEIRKVDEDCGRGGLHLDALGQPPKNAIECAEISDHFKRPDNSRLADVAFKLNPCLAHSLAAKTVYLAAWKFLEQAARHFGAVHVAGCLTGDHQKPRGAHGIVFFN